MAKLILILDGTVLQEVPISKERITIGRRAHNDIVIENLSITAEHAVVVTVLVDSVLEDLNSTNGTRINGQPVKKHFLQDGDIIEFAEYSLIYVSESGAASQKSNSYLSDTVTRPASQFLERLAILKVMSGTNYGREIALIKALTTIGRRDGQVVVIARRAQGYCLTRVEDDAYPIVNGISIESSSHTLADGDVIELSGTSMRFLLV